VLVEARWRTIEDATDHFGVEMSELAMCIESTNDENLEYSKRFNNVSYSMKRQRKTKNLTLETFASSCNRG